jgi:hypothetical protein
VRAFEIDEKVAKLADEVGLLRQDRETIGKLEREFVNLRGEIQALKDSVGGEIGRLTCETERVAESVSGLETLRADFEALKLAQEQQ